MVEIGKHKIVAFVSPALKINKLIVVDIYIYDDCNLIITAILQYIIYSDILCSAKVTQVAPRF